MENTPLCTLLTAPEELPPALISWSNLLLLELTPLLTVDTFEFIVDKVCVVLFILFSISLNFVLLVFTPPRYTLLGVSHSEQHHIRLYFPCSHLLIKFNDLPHKCCIIPSAISSNDNRTCVQRSAYHSKKRCPCPIKSCILKSS